MKISETPSTAAESTGSEPEFVAWIPTLGRLEFTYHSDFQHRRILKSFPISKESVGVGGLACYQRRNLADGIKFLLLSKWLPIFSLDQWEFFVVNDETPPVEGGVTAKIWIFPTYFITKLTGYKDFIKSWREKKGTSEHLNGLRTTLNQFYTTLQGEGKDALVCKVNILPDGVGWFSSIFAPDSQKKLVFYAFDFVRDLYHSHQFHLHHINDSLIPLEAVKQGLSSEAALAWY